MKRVCFFVITLLSLGSLRGQFNYTPPVGDPEEELRLYYDPSRQITGYNIHLAWQGIEGRTYYVEQSNELRPGIWTIISPTYYVTGTSRSIHTLDLDVENLDQIDRLFFRLRYTEGLEMAANNQNFADTDLDGVVDINEMAGPTHKTNPFIYTDVDGDELSDDWEYYRVGNLTDLSAETVYSGSTAYVAFKRDWVKGIRVYYGTQYFRFQDAQWIYHRSVLLRGDQNGAMRIVFADETLSSIEAIEVLPNYPPSYFSSDEDTEKPAAVYHYESAYGGFIYSQREGTGPYAGLAGRDLLRGITLLDTPSGASRPTGVPIRKAFKRSPVTVGGVTKTVLTPVGLAITSQPLTRISPRSFPVVLRDMDSYQTYSYGNHLDFTAAVPYPEISYKNALKTDLGSDGLPVANDDSNFYIYGLAPFKSPRTFSTWYRSANAQTYTVLGVPAPTEAEPGFLPPVPAGHSQRYPYGVFVSDFYPHAADVGIFHSMDKDGFTTEWRMKLDYTEATKLYFAADDDCWVFINGKMQELFDWGGVNLSLNVPSLINLTQILPELALSEGNGTCDIAIFHAARLNSSWNQQPSMRLLSTTPLRPIYHYQVVAENDGLSAIQYELVSGPAGMTISADTGRLEWDVFGKLSPTGVPELIGTNQSVTVRATDAAGRIAEQSFTVEIVND